MENTVRAPISEKNPGPVKTLSSAAWLGWKIESNWTDPFIFAFYSIVRPITQAAILIVMYLVIRGGKIEENGTHEELLNLHGYYYDLYTQQFCEDRTAESLGRPESDQARD